MRNRSNIKPNTRPCKVIFLQWSMLNCLIDYEKVCFATYPRYGNVHLRMRTARGRAGTPARRGHRLLSPRSLRRDTYLRRISHRYRLSLPLPSKEIKFIDDDSLGISINIKGKEMINEDKYFDEFSDHDSN